MNVKLMSRPLIAGMIACVATTLTVSAQTTSSPYEPELNSIVMETSVDIANFKSPVQLPALVVALVSSGQAQMRARFDNYDPIGRTLRSTLYLTAASAPMPLPASALPPASDPSMVSQSIIRVESIFHVPSATQPSIALVGRFVTYLGGASPVPASEPFMCSFGYPADAISSAGDSAAAFTEFSFLIPGALNLYAATATGSIIVTPPPVSTPMKSTPKATR